MKKYMVVAVALVVLGNLGYASYKLVGFAKASFNNKIITQKSEIANLGEKDSYLSSGESVENFYENSSDGAVKDGQGSGSAYDFTESISTDNSDFSGRRLDFSSADEFILSYDSLVGGLGSDEVRKRVVHSSYYGSSMWVSNVGSIEVWSYQSDDSVRVVYIWGTDVVEEVRGFVDDTVKVYFEEGNTVIDVVGGV